MSSSVTGAGRTGQEPERRRFATGWTVFAAIMLIAGGTMAIFQGISAILKDELIVVTRHYVYSMNTSGWGWVHLILGIVVVLAGVALFSGAAWARVVGVLIAGLSMIANFLWLPYYPFWALVLIAIDAFVIWALCVGTTRTADVPVPEPPVPPAATAAGDGGSVR
ncbi:hypothetical protein BX285_3949 [Streptomyces sp. 1114.5]|uniref:DUF7144 family membrane protein n=1 Tax=unclassified Streptomyces TaxID=2593676 RepID=UPI000BD7335E|nr:MULTISPECIES: hypothetical protein [unclassified Streptomyces]RKT19491.1 hypothetical protein BX285_3949 [Streptomyces sp. 1114.5]SOB85687.1 hypothetical protein SAMN06272789_5978 [Streptomyces sp. 1331.2]